jgi:hypothetical protein
MFTVDLGDLGRFAARMKRLTIFADDRNPILNRAIGDLLKSWERRLEEGNRKGVLAGLDKDGHPAPALTYRPRGEVRKLTVAQRLGQHSRKKRGQYSGGTSAGLTTTEYRHLDGPRLAPRRQFSRIIANVETGQGKDTTQRFVWFASLAWRDIVSRKGYRFLKVHFDGLPLGKGGPVKRYDLRGIRPVDRDLMKRDLRNWVKLLIRGHYSG